MINYKYSEITHQIIGAAMRVHSELGNGFQEVIYQRSLENELNKAHLDFEREVETDIYYDSEFIGTRRVDFIVENTILVELKAVSEITSIHFNQILAYLKAYKIEVGLLINFGKPSLEFKRFVKSKTD